MTRILNDATISLIETFEGFRATPYRDEAGHLTIGYGHMITPGESFDTPISQDDATALMRKDLINAENTVDRYINVTLNDNQYGALVSLVYNIGSAPLNAPLGQHINNWDFTGAASHILLYNKVFVNRAFVVSNGLVRRRQAEHDLFLTPVGA